MRAALSEVPGVKGVQVDFNHRTAVVLVEKDDFDTGALVEALATAGYEAKVLPQGA